MTMNERKVLPSIIDKVTNISRFWRCECDIGKEYSVNTEPTTEMIELSTVIVDEPTTAYSLAMYRGLCITAEMPLSCMCLLASTIEAARQLLNDSMHMMQLASSHEPTCTTSASPWWCERSAVLLVAAATVIASSHVKVDPMMNGRCPQLRVSG